MKQWFKVLSFLSVVGFSSHLKADPSTYVRGFSLTEIGTAVYDAAVGAAPKTDAQLTVDKLYDLGVRHINLAPRAIMTDPRGHVIESMVPLSDRGNERRRYDRLIRYVHSKGMTVGIRPIFFVQHSNGGYPYYETLADGTRKLWWHGNIQPRDTRAWFESWSTFLEFYADIAKFSKVEEFTIGAELYSMTVGLEDQWAENPYGFPGNWLDLLRKFRKKLGTNVRIMYDINFTDDRVDTPTSAEYGGELARWRYRLVDLANPTDPKEEVIWKNLVAFWSELDAIGIDMYRSLIPSADETVPEDYGALVEKLRMTSDQYAAQLDNAMFQIESVVGVSKPLIFKEIGFKSITKGFFEPFVYSGDKPADINIQHQAAAYDAIFQSLWAPQLSWFGGFVFWDASVSQNLHGPTDPGFSPIGKPTTESVLSKYFK
jgi:hypothetical protein